MRKWVILSVNAELSSSVIKLLYNNFPNLKRICMDGTQTTRNLMPKTKKSTALLIKLDENSSGLMYTSSIMVLSQTISDEMVCTQICLEFKQVTFFRKHIKSYKCSSKDISLRKMYPKQ